jgi:hypothetical protein
LKEDILLEDELDEVTERLKKTIRSKAFDDERSTNSVRDS